MLTADSLAAAISSVAALVLPASAAWAWKTQQTLTEHTTQLAERKDAEDEWREDLKARLVRIETKIDGGSK